MIVNVMSPSHYIFGLMKSRERMMMMYDDVPVKMRRKDPPRKIFCYDFNPESETREANSAERVHDVMISDSMD